MESRREFLAAITYPAGFLAAGAVLPMFTRRAYAAANELAATAGSAAEIAADEDFWGPIQRAFTMDRGIINLNNGGVSPAPGVVQDAMVRHLQRANSYPPPYVLWREQEPERESVRERLAMQWGTDAEEIALTRNASESLQICQLGMDLARGDEILAMTHDYPRMVTTFKQRERREGIVFKQISLPLPCEDPAEIVKRYEEAISPRTKLMLVSHVVFLNGQVLPVKEIVAMARTKNGGIPVIVDGAHAFAHLDYRIGDLGCDYYGVSLHKWLCAPHGTGLLYVRKDRIAPLWSLMGSEEKNAGDIRKFEEIGTHPVANTLAIAEALMFHQAIGGDRKAARLRFLRDRWVSRLSDSCKGRLRLYTSLKPAFSGGICTASIDGLDNAQLSNFLWDKHKILTVAVKNPPIDGLRITPNVYTTIDEVDRFCAAVEFAVKNGLPKPPEA